MFDKLKKRLTLIYTGIFSLIMVFVVAVTVAIGCISVLRTEKDMLIADITTNGANGLAAANCR